MHGSYWQLIASILGFLTTGCDACLTRDKEKEYIWKRPLQVTVVLCLFVLARYLALAVHIGDIIFASLRAVWSPDYQPSHNYCVVWLIFRIASCHSMLLILELILSIRVFALYERSLKMGVFLSMMPVGRISGLIYINWVALLSRLSETKFSGECVVAVSIADNPSGNIILAYAIVVIAHHLILHGLALKRTTWDLRRYAMSKLPLVSTLNRDGVKVCTAVSVGFVALGVSTNKVAMPALFVYPLFIALLSNLGCRTILNLQTLDMVTQSSKENIGIVELTIINDLSTWDTATRSELAEHQENLGVL